MEQDTQDGAMQSWFKVTIPFGRKYDKTWLMNSIQRHCIVPFTPIDFHYDKNRARFFVQDARAASALKDVSYRICNEEGRKILLTVIPSSIPYSVQNKFTAEQMEQLKLTMKKRYDVSQQSLDLQKLRFDPDLKGQKIDMVLNRRYCMFATLQIIQRNFPELSSLNLCNNKLYGLDGLSDVVEKAPQVKILNLSKNQLKSALELNKLKGMKLEELWLEGNPFCRIFLDQSVYVSSDSCLEQCAPPHQQAQVSSWDTRTVWTTASCSPFSPRNSLCDYFKHSRNMKNLKDSFLQEQLLKHKKLDIVDSLSVLPKTQHDFSSFFMDMWLQMVSTCFFPGTACATLRTYCLLSLKWKESPRDVFVPSRGPSLLPLAAIQGKYCAVGGNPNPSLGPVVCECGDVVLGVFSVLWKVSRYIQVVKRKELWSWNTSFP
uniref:Nuclear RNA export factor Tap RNA-binding domain-containing protein n=1 Tax=Castor canadensis TaxID=51338 RepID=A0A8C0WM18_CASCN